MLTSYVKIAIRVLLRRKFFTAISLFGISFTLTVLMVFASVADQLVGARAPEVHRHRSLTAYHAAMKGENSSSSGSPGYYLLDTFARDLPGCEAMTVFTDSRTVTAWLDGRKIESTIKRTDGAFWEVYRFDFLEGGPYTDEDDARGNFVAVINETTRRRFFDGAPALGRTMSFEGREYRVVGVVRDVSMLFELPFAEIWAPLRTLKAAGFERQWLGGFKATLLFPGRGAFAGARAEFAARLEQAELPDPARFDRVEAELHTPLDHFSAETIGDGERRPGLLKALVAAGILLFMLLPAVNLVNLNLSRILERASEIGVRKSFGASAGTLVGQFLVENVVLTLVGGVIGLALSFFALELLNAYGPLPYAHHVMHPRVFVYGLVLVLVFGVLSGVWPAWRMSRLDPVEALRGRTA
jgi:putative ABC transport system permease protein